MADPNSSSSYDAVLADLRAKRDEINSAIDLLTRLRGGSEGPRATASEGSDDAPELGDGAYLGMSIADAVLKLLTARKRKMTNSEIYKSLTDGGMVLTSKDPTNVINSVLTRRFNAAGDIVRVDRGTWGLKAWYPGRNFQKPKVDSSGVKPTEDEEDPDIDMKYERWREEQAELDHAASQSGDDSDSLI